MTVFNKACASNIDSALQGIIDRGLVPGNALAVYVGGERVYESYRGWQDLAHTRRTDSDTMYLMYSMTKPVTVTAVLQLWERGLIEFSDPVSEYIPEFAGVRVMEPDGSLRPAARPITINHLLTMTSGIAYGGVEGAPKLMTDLGHEWLAEVRAGRPWDTLTAVRRMASVPLSFDPGDSYLYGLGHDVLGAVIEVVTGCNLAEYCEKYIFAPLGMEHAGFGVPDRSLLAQEVIDTPEGLAGKVGVDAPTLDIMDFDNPVYFAGGAGLACTLDDYCRFTHMLANGGTLDGARILGKNTVRLMATPHLNERQLETYNTSGGNPMVCGKNFSFGLGVRVLTAQPHPYAVAGTGEWGWGGALGTWHSIDPENDLFFVYAHQRLGVPGDYLRSLPVLYASIHSCLD